MTNQFRLRPFNMFERPEENAQEDPLPTIFLSVEGNNTEKQYFYYIDKYKNILKIKYKVKVLPRAQNDGHSAPKAVLDLLDQYLELRSSENLPERIRDVIPNKYSDDFIKAYLDGSESIDGHEKQELELLLAQAGYDIELQEFHRQVQKNKKDNDAFGMIIDRDHASLSHSVDLLHDVQEQCNNKGYNFFITTPCFEFWLLLHLIDVKKEYSERLQEFKLNKRISKSHTTVSEILAQHARHKKEIKKDKFEESYLHNIDNAINRVKESFSTSVEKLIGTNDSEDSALGELGSNLPELFNLLRELKPE